MFKTVLLISILLVLTVGALAADISGKWVAQVPGRDGQTRETTFNFKVAGDKLTGTVSGRQGQDTAISEGKVSGDAVTFVVTMERGGNTVKQNYTGKISGDSIAGDVGIGPMGSFPFSGKRA
jgi:hypothetical protein